MAIRSFQRSTRFTNNEWDAVVGAAEKAGITPGSFVRKAAARAAADDLYLYGGGLTPELAELIQADPPWRLPAHLPEAGGARRIGGGKRSSTGLPKTPAPPRSRRSGRTTSRRRVEHRMPSSGLSLPTVSIANRLLGDNP